MKKATGLAGPKPAKRYPNRSPEERGIRMMSLAIREEILADLQTLFDDGTGKRRFNTFTPLVNYLLALYVRTRLQRPTTPAHLAIDPLSRMLPGQLPDFDIPLNGFTPYNNGDSGDELSERDLDRLAHTEGGGSGRTSSRSTS